MENSVEKTTEQIWQKIEQDFMAAPIMSEPRPKTRAPRSSLAKIIKTPEQAKRLRALMKAVHDGLL